MRDWNRYQHNKENHVSQGEKKRDTWQVLERMTRITPRKFDNFGEKKRQAR